MVMLPSARFSSKVMRRYHKSAMSDINVTPFVDVMLVLLVIFMVAAPLMTVGVQVDLPEADTAPITENEEPLVVTINKKGEIFIQETATTADKFIPRLAAITKNNTSLRIYVRGDQSLNYGRIMQVMGQLNRAGYTRIALIAELPK